MGKFLVNYLIGYFRSAAVIRYIVTMIAQAIAAKFALDATQTGALQEWLFAGISQLVAFAPAVLAQIFHPTDDAMKVAVEADKIIAGDKDKAVVQTADHKPNIVVQPQGGRGGQG